MTGRLFLILLLLWQVSPATAQEDHKGSRPGASSTGNLKKVRFPPGSASVILEGTVTQGGRDQYVVGARRGQRMTLRVMSIDDGALVKVFGPVKGAALAGGGAAGTTGDWHGQLPASGSYKIVVDSFCERTNYILELTLD